MSNYEVYIDHPEPGSPRIIKAWTKGVPFAENALEQAKNTASMPFIHKHIAIMPDVHLGKGATIGSVVPTIGAIIPACVGVDLGCGVIATRTTLTASDLPDNLKSIRNAIELAVPHGRTDNGGANDIGRWRGDPTENVLLAWDMDLRKKFEEISHKHPKIEKSNNVKHLGTLGTGNHFIEMCLDTEDRVWFMLHSGSRGVGGRIGSYFIEMAKQDMKKWFINVPDVDLAYFPEGTEHFDDYIEAVGWAQKFAHMNRQLMMQNLLHEIRLLNILPEFQDDVEAVNNHHNYVQKEQHFGKNVWITRKGACCARKGMMSVIPGCFAAGTRVLMSNGLYKDIELIRPGDRIISGTGEATQVINNFNRGKRATWVYRNNNSHSETRATPDHQHYIGKLPPSCSKQGKAKALGSGIDAQGNNKYMWRALNKLPEHYTLLFPKKVYFDDLPISFAENHEPWSVVPTYGIGYIFGTFLGDGTAYYAPADGGQVTWAFGLNETEIVNKLMEELYVNFELVAKEYIPKKGNIRLVVVHKASFARMFLGFGTATKKSLPAKYWCSNIKFLKGLYDGLIDSDGHKGAGTLKFTNTSTELIEQFGIIHYLLFGYMPSVGYRKPSAGGLKDCNVDNCNPSYRSTSLKLPQLTKQHQCVNLNKLNKDNEIVEVYDIEVEHEDHSFIANNVIVHNSMGAKSYIARGLGHPDSFNSCSHGAGRVMSRTEAKKTITVEDHIKATAGVECLKDESVLDESPACYKSIEAVMAAQTDLVEIVHTLKQVCCIKG